MTPPNVLLTVHRVLDFRDGTIPMIETTETVWPGYTASKAAAWFQRRMRDARRDYTRAGNIVTVTTDKEVWLETETYEFTEVPDDAA